MKNSCYTLTNVIFLLLFALVSGLAVTVSERSNDSSGPVFLPSRLVEFQNDLMEAKDYIEDPRNPCRWDRLYAETASIINEISEITDVPIPAKDLIRTYGSRLLDVLHVRLTDFTVERLKTLPGMMDELTSQRLRFLRLFDKSRKECEAKKNCTGIWCRFLAVWSRMWRAIRD
ncbi:hypothetical protein FRC03_003509 [Tulasnella sp. 419]|nr:hypothetical protein FRC03_003509 [Tulasnella sp. 419]